MARRSSTFWSIGLILLLSSGPLSAQAFRLKAEAENLRDAPRGAKIGTVFQGTPFSADAKLSGWVAAVLEGWMWRPSLKMEGDSLVVNVQEENLRARPQGPVVARLLRGVQVQSLEEEGWWTRLRVRGWIWEQSTELVSAEPARPSAPPVGEGTIYRLTVPRENFRAAPGGNQIGRLLSTASLIGLGERGPWLEARVEGWMWKRSLEEDRGQLVVRVPEENLRERPRGERLGILLKGVSLEKLGEVGDWFQVRARGWIWRASVAKSGEAAERPALGAGPPPVRGQAFLRRGDEDLRLTPGGQPMGKLSQGAPLEVVGRRGNWAKVRLEGWVWAPALTEREAEVATPEPLTPVEVRKSPEAHQGKVVRWQVEFVSLERADRLRTDFYPGEPYLLTRETGGEKGFIYIALSDELATRAARFAPFQKITVLGKIRTGKSQLLGNPVLDLISFME